MIAYLWLHDVTMSVNGRVLQNEVMSENERTPQANIAPFGLRMQPDLKARVEAAARASERSMNAEIVARLGRSFDEKGISFLSKLSDWNSLAEVLPVGLKSRIEQAALSRDRSAQEEVVQALEAAFPPPQQFSLDDFLDKWMDGIAAAQERDRPEMVIQANQALEKAGMNKYVMWLEPRDDRESAVSFGTKRAREHREKTRGVAKP